MKKKVLALIMAGKSEELIRGCLFSDFVPGPHVLFP